MKSIQPINDNVLIKTGSEENEKTSGGLYIPDTAKEKPLMGEVMGISPELETPLSVGDTVLYKQFSGTETNFDGTDYVLISIGDILAKIVEADAIP